MRYFMGRKGTRINNSIWICPEMGHGMAAPILYNLTRNVMTSIGFWSTSYSDKSICWAYWNWLRLEDTPKNLVGQCDVTGAILWDVYLQRNIYRVLFIVFCQVKLNVCVCVKMFRIFLPQANPIPCKTEKQRSEPKKSWNNFYPNKTRSCAMPLAAWPAWPARSDSPYHVNMSMGNIMINRLDFLVFSHHT